MNDAIARLKALERGQRVWVDYHETIYDRRNESLNRFRGTFAHDVVKNVLAVFVLRRVKQKNHIGRIETRLSLDVPPLSRQLFAFVGGFCRDNVLHRNAESRCKALHH